jgi:hypothetical protein
VNFTRISFFRHVQEDYNPEEYQQTIKNAEAVPVFFHFLRGGPVEVQQWGLGAWRNLINGSMPNLSACERSCPACKQWLDVQNHFWRLCRL